MSGDRFDLTCSHRNCEYRGTYELPVRCTNCGAKGIGVFTKGHEASRSRCPQCETQNLRVTR